MQVLMHELQPTGKPNISHPQALLQSMLKGVGSFPFHEPLAWFQEFMSEHDFKSIEDFRGASLPYFTSHRELVKMQKENKAKRRGLANDAEWSGDGFVKETESMVAN